MNKKTYRLLTPFDNYYKKSILSYNFIYKYTNYKTNNYNNDLIKNNKTSDKIYKPIFYNNISNIYYIQKN